MRTLVEEVDEMGYDVIITVTDGYTDWPDQSTSRLVWVITERGINYAPDGVPGDFIFAQEAC